MERRTIFDGWFLPAMLVLPQLLLTAFFFLWPAGEAIWWSMTRQDPFGLGSAFVGLENFSDLFADPQFRARGMRIDVEGTPGVKTPIVMSESPLTLERRSPRLGEHQAEILREIGLG